LPAMIHQSLKGNKIVMIPWTHFGPGKCNVKNEEEELNVVNANPSISIHWIAHETGLSQSIVWYPCKRNKYIFVVQLAWDLLTEHSDLCFQFCWRYLYSTVKKPVFLCHTMEWRSHINSKWNKQFKDVTWVDTGEQSCRPILLMSTETKHQHLGHRYDYSIWLYLKANHIGEYMLASLKEHFHFQCRVYSLTFTRAFDFSMVTLLTFFTPSV
jgi:hypothetical protein